MHFVFSNVLTEYDNDRGGLLQMHFYYACVLKIIECFFCSGEWWRCNDFLMRATCVFAWDDVNFAC